MNLHASIGKGIRTVWVQPGSATGNISPGATPITSSESTRILPGMVGCTEAMGRAVCAVGSGGGKWTAGGTGKGAEEGSFGGACDPAAAAGRRCCCGLGRAAGRGASAGAGAGAVMGREACGRTIGGAVIGAFGCDAVGAATSASTDRSVHD